MGKKTPWSFAAIVLIVSLLFADDELDPEVENFLRLATSTSDSEAYLYLLGFGAIDERSPLEFGREIYASIQVAEEEYLREQKDFEFEFDLKDKLLSTPEGKEFCKLRKDGCLDYLFTGAYDLDQISLSHSVLSQRYEEFMGIAGYATLTLPIRAEIWPNYSYLTTGDRIVGLKAIDMAKRGDVKQASELLFGNILRLRSKLSELDQYILKIHYLNAISGNLDLLSVVLQEGGVQLPHKFNSVTLEERDMSIPMARELAYIYDLHAHMDEDLREHSIGKYIARGLMRISVKPNISINQVYPAYKSAVDLSLMKQDDVSGALANLVKFNPSAFSYVRNPVGNHLVETSWPDYSKYIVMFFDLNAKIVIFNATSNGFADLEGLDSLYNPYYETRRTANYTKDGKSICFGGPLRDDRKMRCLRIQL